MGLFDAFATRKALKRLEELEDRCERLERDVKSVRLEWENSYDKLRILMGRVAKRAEMMHEKAESEGKLYPEAEDTPQDTTIVPSPVWARLTPAQKRVQMQILARRKPNGGA